MTIVTTVVNLVQQTASCEDKSVKSWHKLKLLIEKVVVYGEDEIEIVWKVDDPFARIKGSKSHFILWDLLVK